MRANSRFAALLAAIAIAAPALAQDAATSQPASEGLGGPVIPGVCLLSREAIFANAAVAKAAAARLKQFSDQAQAELAAERAPVEAEFKAFQAQANTMKAEQRIARDAEIAARLKPIQLKAELRAREIDATRNKVTKRIADEAQPLIANAYRGRKCGLLFDRNAAMGGNFANDLTADVVRGLDQKIQTISFEREVLAQ